VREAPALPKPVTLFLCGGLAPYSVWFGDGQQGNHDTRLQGNKGIAGLPPEVIGPRGRYLTGLVEPCGALPRKCLFIYWLGFLVATLIVR
jgi:hypothetical protein